MAYPDEGIFFSHKRRDSTDACNNRDKSWKQYFKWKKPDAKGSIVYDYVYREKLQKRQIYGERVLLFARMREREEVGMIFNRCRISFRGDGDDNVLELVVMITPSCESNRIHWIVSNLSISCDWRCIYQSLPSDCPYLEVRFWPHFLIL